MWRKKLCFFIHCRQSIVAHSKSPNRYCTECGLFILCYIYVRGLIMLAKIKVYPYFIIQYLALMRIIWQRQCRCCNTRTGGTRKTHTLCALASRVSIWWLFCIMIPESINFTLRMNLQTFASQLCVCCSVGEQKKMKKKEATKIWNKNVFSRKKSSDLRASTIRHTSHTHTTQRTYRILVETVFLCITFKYNNNVLIAQKILQSVSSLKKSNNLKYNELRHSIYMYICTDWNTASSTCLAFFSNILIAKIYLHKMNCSN